MSSLLHPLLLWWKCLALAKLDRGTEAKRILSSYKLHENRNWVKERSQQCQKRGEQQQTLIFYWATD